MGVDGWREKARAALRAAETMSLEAVRMHDDARAARHDACQLRAVSAALLRVSRAQADEYDALLQTVLRG